LLKKAERIISAKLKRDEVSVVAGQYTPKPLKKGEKEEGTDSEEAEAR